jgi:hypothetical protein
MTEQQVKYLIVKHSSSFDFEYAILESEHGWRCGYVGIPSNMKLHNLVLDTLTHIKNNNMLRIDFDSTEHRLFPRHDRIIGFRAKILSDFDIDDFQYFINFIITTIVKWNN